MTPKEESFDAKMNFLERQGMVSNLNMFSSSSDEYDGDDDAPSPGQDFLKGGR